jgi:hypothetical protein
LQEYQKSHGLPDISSFDTKYADPQVGEDGYAAFDRPDIFSQYIRPYVRHLAEADKTQVNTQVSQTVEELQEEFGMTHLAQLSTQ